MIKFEKVKRFADADFNLPVRKTKNSAGYDFEVAEDIVIPTHTHQLLDMAKFAPQPIEAYTLEEMAKLTKQTKAKPEKAYAESKNRWCNQKRKWDVSKD